MNILYRIVIIILFFPVFSSCEKDSAPELLGTWGSVSNNYLVILNENCTIIDIYNQPWTGSVVLNGEIHEIDDFYFSASNVFGNYILSSESAGIFMHLFENSMIIGTTTHEYTYTGEYEMNLP